MSSALEAKIVVLGSQGVGKTSLVMRYCKGAFQPSQLTSTVGASFMTKRVVDSDTDTVVRLQIWDTGKSKVKAKALEYNPVATVSLFWRASQKNANHFHLQPARRGSGPSRASTTGELMPASCATLSPTPRALPIWAPG
jgi:hypothetical protein